MNVVDSSAWLSYFADDANAADAARFGVLHKLPLADSIIFATAQKYDAILWTQHNDFEGLENVRYISKKSTK